MNDKGIRKEERKELQNQRCKEQHKRRFLILIEKILKLAFNLASNWIYLLLGVIIIFGIFNLNLTVVE